MLVGVAVNCDPIRVGDRRQAAASAVDQDLVAGARDRRRIGEPVEGDVDGSPPAVIGAADRVLAPQGEGDEATGGDRDRCGGGEDAQAAVAVDPEGDRRPSSRSVGAARSLQRSERGGSGDSDRYVTSIATSVSSPASKLAAS
ncbi:MAG: hypothetical protein ACXVZO_10105, partial [Gaiellaceae bacterium]